MSTFSINIGVSDIVRSPNGVFTGNLAIQLDDYYFPEKDWNDFVIILLSWWNKELTSVVLYEKQLGYFNFMDGPFHFNIFRNAQMLTVSCIDKRKTNNFSVFTSETTLQEAVESLVNITQKVLDFCKEQNWVDNSILELKRNHELLCMSA